MSSQPKWQSHTPLPESSARPCILYVEENEAFFRQIKRALENAGYGVIGTSGGWQALALLLTTPIRLVLGGDVLCGADGPELVERMKEAKPGVPVVICSRTLPNSLRGVYAFVSANEPSSQLLGLVKELLAS